MSTGLEVGILIRIGDGRPNEIAETTIPLRAVIVKDEFLPGTAHVEIDYPEFAENIRAALHELADSLPPFPLRAVAE